MGGVSPVVGRSVVVGVSVAGDTVGGASSAAGAQAARSNIKSRTSVFMGCIIVRGGAELITGRLRNRAPAPTGSRGARANLYSFRTNVHGDRPEHEQPVADIDKAGGAHCRRQFVRPLEPLGAVGQVAVGVARAGGQAARRGEAALVGELDDTAEAVVRGWGVFHDNATPPRGTIPASGTLAQIIPPSLVLIILADQLGKSVGDLYAGAFVPGFVLTGLYVGYILLVSLIKPTFVPALPAEARTIREDDGTSGLRSLGILTVLSVIAAVAFAKTRPEGCLLYTSPSPRDRTRSRMPSSA